MNCTKGTDLVCPRKDIIFWLHPRSDNGIPIQLDQYNPASLSSAPFVANAAIKIIIHGYATRLSDPYLVELRNAYLTCSEYTIISVDWSALCVKGCYYHATENIRTVARCVARFLSDVFERIHPISMHLVGHSLGAHVAAWTSREMRVNRVTMLDPALPLFGNKSTLVRTAIAEFVDVYHSNAGLLGQKTTPANLTLNYNNAVFQPGCGCDVKDSHIRSVEFFSAGICNPDFMKAFPCGGWQQYRDDQCPVPTATTMITVGEGADRTRNGSFMMFTNGSRPFLFDPYILCNETNYKSFKNTANSDCEPYDIYNHIDDLFF